MFKKRIPDSSALKCGTSWDLCNIDGHCCEGYNCAAEYGYQYCWYRGGLY